ADAPATEPRGGRRHGRRRSLAAPLLVAGILALAGIAIGLSVWLTGDEASLLGGLEKRYVNETFGYAFRYPPQWTLEEKGTAVKLTNPTNDIIISFGLGPEGPLRFAGFRLAEATRSTYESGEVLAVEDEKIGGRRAYVASGHGVNARDVEIRFLAIIVQGPERNFGITVFVEASASPEDVLPVTQDIVGSFRAFRQNTPD
ncbi:MAG: hypothetical protein ACREJP_01270, partial [Candidatus Methylomirabilales bacterium]